MRARRGSSAVLSFGLRLVRAAAAVRRHRKPIRLARVCSGRVMVSVSAPTTAGSSAITSAARTGSVIELDLDIERVQDPLWVGLDRVGKALLDLRPERLRAAPGQTGAAARDRDQTSSAPRQRQRTPATAAAAIAADSLCLRARLTWVAIVAGAAGCGLSSAWSSRIICTGAPARGT